MTSSLSTALSWYQEKIGTYDKQKWEKSADERILKGVHAIPKKKAKIKPGLIDVDLVRGSTFTKAKPQHSWMRATLSGILRVLLMPFYFSWWKLQTDTWVAHGFIFLYLLQIAALYLFYSAPEGDFVDVPLSEIVMPIAMLFLLGVAHSQIVATFSSKSSLKQISKAQRKTKHCKNNGGYRSHHLHYVSGNTGKKDLNKSQSHKQSDNESGLDVTDTIHLAERKSSVLSLKFSEQSGLHHRPSHQTHSNTGKSNSSFISNKNISGNGSDGDENASSGEELFFPKNSHSSAKCSFNHLTAEKIKNCVKTHLVLSKKSKTCKKIARRFSDVGPVRFVSQKRCIKQRHSEENILDLTDCHGAGSPIKGIRKGRPVSCEKDSDCMHDGVRNGNQLSLEVTLNREDNCSSCDSAADTGPLNTPLKKDNFVELEWPLITNADCNSSSTDSSPQSSHDAGDGKSCSSQSEDPFAWEMQESETPTATVCPGSNKGFQPKRTVSCTIWEDNVCKKVDLSALDISCAIIRKVDSSTHSTDYLKVGVLFALIVSILPLIFRFWSGESTIGRSTLDVALDVINFTAPSSDHVLHIIQEIIGIIGGSTWRMKTFVIITGIERFFLSFFYFFLLSVAERTFKQRFLYAKHFCYLTSYRRAQRTDLPHFRLNKVRNIKNWLSIRSYLKKLGPQRSVDVIVSTAFILEVCVLSLLCVQLLKETGYLASKLHCWETVIWTLALGVFLLRFMILGSKINKKYKNLSILITEQINLYLHMEHKPHKKEELMLANNVLKLAADLLKELESPFKISGLSANSYLYNFTKVVVLSAFSAVLTEVLGFKLKLYKLKIK